MINDAIKSYPFDAQYVVISKKHNQGILSPDNLLIQDLARAALAVKTIDTHNISNEKLRQYFEEGRLAVFTAGHDGQSLFQHAMNFGVARLAGVELIDKSSGKTQKYAHVIFEKMTDEDYQSVFLSIAKEARDRNNSAIVAKPMESMTFKASHQQKLDPRFQKLIKSTFVRSLLTQMSRIIDRLFDVQRQSQKQIDEQKRADQKAYEKIQEGIKQHHLKKRTEKAIEEMDAVESQQSKHDIHHLQNKSQLQNSTGAFISEHLA